MTHHIDSNCVDLAFGAGAYSWLQSQVIGNHVWIDEDVHTMASWDYALGYWVSPSLRYQYWGKAIYLSQSIADDHQSVAATLIHELGHEFGFTDSASDEAQLEFFASLCRM
jgi:hypothetical protein